MEMLTMKNDANPAVEYVRDCPLCQGKSWRVLTTPGHWIGQEVFGDLTGRLGLVRCRDCGLIFTNPRPSNERLNAFYAGDNYCCHETSGSASSGARAEFVLARVSEFLSPHAPRSLLDYGAGGGGFLSHARKSGWTIRGFEPGKCGLENCRRAGLAVTDKLEELPSSAFGLITLHHVFEHLADPRRVLAEIRRLLAPEGLLFVDVPNAASLRARLA
jgi:SAM-dependent methyltransferase